MSYLITGGTGTIGTAILEKLMQDCRRYITIFSRDEQKQFEMQHRYDCNHLRYVIGDIRNAESIANAIDNTKTIFHVAAMKHVGSCEQHPMEAVYTNTIGTYNVIKQAERGGVDDVVIISSDKAVNPVGIMGMTKRISENVALAHQGHTTVTVVRMGNIINSRGSVLGIWRDQMRRGLPLTITDFRATRYFITIDAAAEFIISSVGHGGVVTPKMKACQMGELVYTFMRINNYMNIKEIGLRPGERLHEYITDEQSSDAADWFTQEELELICNS